MNAKKININISILKYKVIVYLNKKYIILRDSNLYNEI